MAIAATLRYYNHTIGAFIFDSTGIEDIYDSIQAWTEINSNYSAMEAEVQKIGLFPWLLLLASVEGPILPKVLERLVQISQLDILFRFIQEKNIEMIASLGTKKATSDEHSRRVYKGEKITK